MAEGQKAWRFVQQRRQEPVGTLRTAPYQMISGIIRDGQRTKDIIVCPPLPAGSGKHHYPTCYSNDITTLVRKAEGSNLPLVFGLVLSMRGTRLSATILTDFLGAGTSRNASE